MEQVSGSCSRQRVASVRRFAEISERSKIQGLEATSSQNGSVSVEIGIWAMQANGREPFRRFRVVGRVFFKDQETRSEIMTKVSTLPKRQESRDVPFHQGVGRMYLTEQYRFGCSPTFNSSDLSERVSTAGMHACVHTRVTAMHERAQTKSRHFQVPRTGCRVIE